MAATPRKAAREQARARGRQAQSPGLGRFPALRPAAVGQTNPRGDPTQPARLQDVNPIAARVQHTDEDPMIGFRICAFALSTALAIICSAPPAIAAHGAWSMIAVTTHGHCGRIPIGFGISRGRIYSTGGSFALHRIQLGGRVSASGQARLSAVAGPRIAHGTGRFRSASGQRDVGRYRALRCLHRRLERHSLLAQANHRRPTQRPAR
jgi:hypothetical protein